LPRYRLVSLGKSRVDSLNVVRGLTHDFHIPNHGILNQLIAQKCGFIDRVCLAVNTLKRHQNVAQIVRHTQRLVHTATASFSTN
jgi:hypothetical protein